MSVWRRFVKRQPVPEFTGAPPVRRIKTYVSQTGYVYQYYFDGSRNGDTSKEFRFQAAIDAKTFAPILVLLPDLVILSWQETAARNLTQTELYGVAKRLLFDHLDQVPPAEIPASSVTLTGVLLERIATELDF